MRLRTEPSGASFWVDDHGAIVDVARMCPRCREPIEGATWNGRCFDCHTASLLPPERWSDDGTPWDDDDPSARPFENGLPE